MLVLYNINSLFIEDNVILCLEDVLEGNQSLNITFKTWINKISTDSDFNSKDLITRKIWFINQIENGRKTTANSQATASTVA